MAHAHNEIGEISMQQLSVLLTSSRPWTRWRNADQDDERTGVIGAIRHQREDDYH
jgi:hypothetical protein